MGCPCSPKMGDGGHTLAESSLLCAPCGHAEGLPSGSVPWTLLVRLRGDTALP